MTEGQAPNQDAASDTTPARRDSDRLKTLGFEPGIPVYLVEDVAFDLVRVRQALFESTYNSPITVVFQDSRDVMSEEPIGHGLPMVVELMQAVYVPAEAHVGSGVLGCHNTPDWYVRGFLYKSGFDPYPEVIPMHAYLEIADQDGSGKVIECAHVQIVRPCSGVDRSAPLVYADGPPNDA
jgi:hypothetical protein